MPTVPRITNITQTSFEIRLQDTGGGSATVRDTSYLVIEEGAWTFPDGTAVEAFNYTSKIANLERRWEKEEEKERHDQAPHNHPSAACTKRFSDFPVEFAREFTPTLGYKPICKMMKNIRGCTKTD